MRAKPTDFQSADLRARVPRRLAVDALLFERAAVYAGLVTVPLKVAVGGALPPLAPALEFFPAVPLADLRAEPIGPDLAHGQKNMRMMIAFIAVLVGKMDRDIRNHPLAHELLAHIIFDEALALLGGQFVRQANLHL